MGWTSQDDLINQITSNGKADTFVYQKSTAVVGVGGEWRDLGVSAGTIPASTYGAADLTFTATDDTWSEGAQYHGGDKSPATKHLLSCGASVTAAAGAPWVLMCVDQVGYVKLSTTNVSTTGVKTVTMTPISNTAAKVDRYANGEGLRMYMSAVSTMGANAPTCTIQYTNSAGTASRNTTSFTSTASATAGFMLNTGLAASGKYSPFIALQAGDTGVKDIESVTWAGTAHASGTVALHLVKPLFTIPLPASALHVVMDFVNTIPSLRQIKDGANLRFILFNNGATTAGGSVLVNLDYGWGG